MTRSKKRGKAATKQPTKTEPEVLTSDATSLEFEQRILQAKLAEAQAKVDTLRAHLAELTTNNESKSGKVALMEQVVGKLSASIAQLALEPRPSQASSVFTSSRSSNNADKVGTTTISIQEFVDKVMLINAEKANKITAFDRCLLARIERAARKPHIATALADATAERATTTLGEGADSLAHATFSRVKAEISDPGVLPGVSYSYFVGGDGAVYESSARGTRRVQVDWQNFEQYGMLAVHPASQDGQADEEGEDSPAGDGDSFHGGL